MYSGSDWLKLICLSEGGERSHSSSDEDLGVTLIGSFVGGIYRESVAVGLFTPGNISGQSVG